jgi:hypothetical protein
VKNALKRWVAAFQSWTAAADEEFSKKDDQVKQIYFDILNDWR